MGMPEDKNSILPPRVPPARGGPILPDEQFILPRRLPLGSEPRSVEEQFPLDPLFKFPDSRPGITVLAVDKSMESLSPSSEDACAISADETKLAICDGVSQSSIPRIWASLIANKWVEDPLIALDNQSWNEWLKDLRSAWVDWVNYKWVNHLNRYNLLAGRPLTDTNAAGYQRSIQEVLAGGPSTTFLGVNIDKSKAEMQVIAIGDSNMVLINPNTGAYRSFPLQDPSEFSSSPYQISNKPGQDIRIRGVNVTVKSLKRDEILVMATDKFSEWLLKGLKQDFKGTMAKIQNLDQAQFHQLATQERELGSSYSANDDLTIMIVDLNNYLNPPKPPQVRPLL